MHSCLQVHSPWRVRSGFCTRQAHSNVWKLSHRLAQRRQKGRLLGPLTEHAMQACRQWGLAWSRQLYRAAISSTTDYAPSPITDLTPNVYQSRYPGFQKDLHALQLEYTLIHYTARRHLAYRNWLPRPSLILVIHSPSLSLLL
jgi:hypothetical protein